MRNPRCRKSVLFTMLRMALLIGLVLGFPHDVCAQEQRPPATAKDSTQRRTVTREDSVRLLRREMAREARAVARRAWDAARPEVTVTEEERGSAFRDSSARTILTRARAAREQQDSALRSYRALVTQRVAVGLGVRRIGLEKTLFQADNVARIAWSRGGGVWVTPVGSRVHVPMAGGENADGDVVDIISIPYYPGRESLWIPGSNQFGTVRAQVDPREIVHPIANGAERYYRYTTGDSITITLGGDRTIRLRELQVSARRPEWRLFVGSFWFDEASGQLVRAAYRLAVPLEIWDTQRERDAEEAVRSALTAAARDSIARERLTPEEYSADSVRRAGNAGRDQGPPAWVKLAFRPARASLDGITVEYGLYGGKFWLPLLQSATASADIGPLRAPVTFDEQFVYEDVDGDFTTPQVPDVVPGRGASVTIALGGDSAQRAARRDARDSLRTDGRCAPGDSTFVRTDTRYGGALRIAYDMPCDMDKLRMSDALPPLNASDAELFDVTARDELLKALNLNVQAQFFPGRPALSAGLDQQRFNRVEGLSLGVGVTQPLGAGFSAIALARMGTADRVLNGEVQLARSAGRRTVHVAVYRRLRATQPEWGNPLSFGASMSALLYGRDEGFYFRARGVEVGDRMTLRHGSWSWRLYTEQQGTAGDSSVVNTWSLARAFGHNGFRPNFLASRLSLTGVDVQWSRAFAARPLGVQWFTTVRADGATGTVTYGRAAIEATARRDAGPAAVSLTASAGSSVGAVPPQQRWFLGGVRSVRGHTAGSLVGDAHWFLRAEAGTRFGVVRPVLFFDTGWAGARRLLGSDQMMRGAGAGVSLLDGLFRIDASRNVARGGRWRVDAYLEAPI